MASQKSTRYSTTKSDFVPSIIISLHNKNDYPNLNQEYSEIFRRQPSYPAINIGHLAVRNDMQSRGIGRLIVEFVAATFSHIRIAGCQFLTVDALNNPRTINFYHDKIGMEFQTVYDMGAHTRRMFLDIFSSPEDN